jgi:sugar lactone lactonase YvrE
VSATGTITTFAGNGTAGFTGDGGPATSAQINGPSGVVVDQSGNLYIADSYNAKVRKVSASGIITTITGPWLEPMGVAVDSAGTLYVSDYFSQVWKVSTGGTITTVAGNGTQGYSGDGGPATAAMLHGPWGVAVDGSGNVYIADQYNNRIRRVSASGTITTVAGTGATGFSGDGGPATSAALSNPQGVSVNASGDVFICDIGNSRIRRVSASGTITTVAGNGSFVFSGDGGPATAAGLGAPRGVAFNASGDLYIADSVNNRIRKVTSP